MTVKELIELLSQYEDQIPVYVEDEDEEGLLYRFPGVEVMQDPDGNVVIYGKLQ
jgi:hypothetical protein